MLFVPVKFAVAKSRKHDLAMNSEYSIEKGKQSMCFVTVPTVRLVVETPENVAALNVDYSAWIIKLDFKAANIHDLSYLFLKCSKDDK